MMHLARLGVAAAVALSLTAVGCSHDDSRDTTPATKNSTTYTLPDRGDPSMQPNRNLTPPASPPSDGSRSIENNSGSTSGSSTSPSPWGGTDMKGTGSSNSSGSTMPSTGSTYDSSGNATDTGTPSDSTSNGTTNKDTLKKKNKKKTTTPQNTVNQNNGSSDTNY